MAGEYPLTDTGEAVATLGSGIAGQVPAGLAGLVEYFRQLGHARALGRSRPEARELARERAAKATTDVGAALTYEPRTEAGRERVAKIGQGIETLGEQAMEVPGIAPTVRGWQDFTAAAPGLAAITMGAAEVVGPGKGKPKVPKLPAVREATQAAQALRLREMGGSGDRRMFEVYSQGGSGPILGAVFAPDVATAEARAAQHFGGGQPQPQHVQTPRSSADAALQRRIEAEGGGESDLTARVAERGERYEAQAAHSGEPVRGTEGFHPLYVQRQARERGLSYDETLRILQEGGELPDPHGPRIAEAQRRMDEAREAGNRPAYDAWSRELRLAQMDQERGYEPPPSENLASRRQQIEREIAMQQQRELARRMLDEGGAEQGTPIQGRVSPALRELIEQERLERAEGEPLLKAQTRQEAEQLARSQALREQGELPGVKPAPEDINPQQLMLPGMELSPEMLAAQAKALRAHKALELQEAAKYGENPDLMNREAVAAFITEARENPDILQYGLAPPRDVRGIERMAKHFGRVADEDINVDIETSYGESDEPYKIEKKHGRGEVMRDRYGDYKMEEAEAGDKLREQDTGDIKKKEVEVELFGPPTEEEGVHPVYGPQLMGTKRVPVRARGGEMVFDESGDPVYRKSRGGELYRDERGRPKEIENPDYEGERESGEKWTLSLPSGAEMIADLPEGDIMSVDATGIGKGKGGALLYQTLLADAARGGYEIGSSGLTDSNTLRLLSNTLANYVRMGRNPRSVSGTAAGKATRARGRAEGPEIWRAEAEETKQRMNEYESDVPGKEMSDRVRFDGEEFRVDGRPVDPKELLTALDWDKDAIKATNVGQKTIMRMAFFDWLRGADPAEAAKVAKEWKKWGPLFGIAGATALASMSGEEVNEAMQ